MKDYGAITIAVNVESSRLFVETNATDARKKKQADPRII